MQEYEDFQSARTALREPRVPLTEAQYADYQSLMTRAELLHVEGKHDDARRTKLVAAKIAQSGAPCLD